MAYVYLNYGIHALVNVVTEGVGRPAAVLIRALEPVDGVTAMRRRRLRPAKGRRATRLDADQAALCRGPGNLTVAMGITLDDNGADLTGDRLCIEAAPEPRAFDVAWGPRVGIRVGTERPWRAWMLDHPGVSRPLHVAHVERRG